MCLISAAVGAGIDHYWDELPSIAELYWTKTRSLAGFNVRQTEQKTTNPSAMGSVEVLGDGVSCDVRYTELKIPESEYRTFFDRCMGNTGSTKKAE